MQYLSIKNASKSYGEKILFSDLDLSVSKGEKIALVAKNGSGKSTLLRIIADEESAEGENCDVWFAKDIRIAFLKQDPDYDPHLNVLDTVYQSEDERINALKNYEKALLEDKQDLVEKHLARVEDLKAWNIESKIKEILGKLDIHNLDQLMGNLSGGQRKRVALAKILISEPDFLILDEPTNHLDLDMIEWLEDYLRRTNLTLFMVTHDRYFLERVCNQIIELDNGQLYVYTGNYSDYLEKKAHRQQVEAVNLEKTKKLFKKELDWIRKQPKARGTKAKSRVDSFQDIKKEAKQQQSNDELQLMIKTARMGSKVLELHNISKSYGDKCIVDGFSYKFKKGERLGIIGPNGAGKSTLLRLMTSDLETETGKVVIGETVVFGHFKQEGLTLKKDKKVIDVVRDIAEYIPLEKGKKITAASLLERFLFPRPQQQVYVSQLSGGEKRRLHLLTVLVKNPNFLILDEPTNDLDVLTLNVLEDYLESYGGVLVIVSHDRYFMDKLVSHLFVMDGAGGISDVNGNYSQYRERIKNSFEGDRGNTKSGASSTSPDFQKESKKPKISYKEKMEYAQLEKDIDKLTKRKNEISEAFLNPDLSSDEISSLSKELSEIDNTIESKEERWFELAEKIEAYS